MFSSTAVYRLVMLLLRAASRTAENPDVTRHGNLTTTASSVVHERTRTDDAFGSIM